MTTFPRLVHNQRKMKARKRERNDDVTTQPYRDFTGQADQPATPPAGQYRLYVDDAGDSWIVDDTGTAAAVGGAGGGVPDPLLLSDGTAGAPSLAFTDHATTGLYHAVNVDDWGSDNMLALAVAGVVRLLLDADWNTIRAFSNVQLQGNTGRAFNWTDQADTVNLASLTVARPGGAGVGGVQIELQARDASGVTQTPLHVDAEDGHVRIGASGGLLAFLGGTPSAAIATEPVATDLATAIALANDLRARLIQIGLLTEA